MLPEYRAPAGRVVHQHSRLIYSCIIQLPGADVTQQYLNLGAIDELAIRGGVLHVAVLQRRRECTRADFGE